MPKLIIINGPIACGKTTLCQALLKVLTTFAFVDRAYLKDMLKSSGREDAKLVADKTVDFMVKELMRLKKDVLVQERSMSSLKEITRQFEQDYSIHSFFLRCDLQEAVVRDQKREKKSGDIEQITASHTKAKPDSYDILLDTDELSPEETVDKVLCIINDGQVAPEI